MNTMPTGLFKVYVLGLNDLNFFICLSLTENENPESKTPGIAIIFHNDEWPDHDEMYREGSTKDIDLIRNTLELYSISVLIVQNPTFEEISRVINKGKFLGSVYIFWGQLAAKLYVMSRKLVQMPMKE